MFSLRIFLINYYVAKPEPDWDPTYSDFRCAEIKHVPVIRVFGITPEGQKSCLHVHNFFPYLLIRLQKRIENRSELQRYMFDLANQIDRTMNTAMCMANNPQHVYKIEPVQTKSMYGYHEKESCFLKIHLYNPDLIRKLADLLLNGVIMGESFQPYESHVPFNLQFLMDFNLFGMNLIHLDSVKFRRFNTKDENEEAAITPTYLKSVYTKSSVVNPSQPSQVGSSQGTRWNITELDESLLLNESIERQSTCELELDAKADEILNVNMDKDGFMINPGLSNLWEEEKNRREALGIDKPLELPDLEERTAVIKADNETELRNRLISLLETRFGASYPFDKEKSVSPESWLGSESPDSVSSHQNFDADDERILDILDDLHNDAEEDESEQDDEDAGLDSSMLHATQLNDQDKEALLKENAEMTIIETKHAENANVSFEKENEHFLNPENDESSSSSSEDEVEGGQNKASTQRSRGDSKSGGSKSSSQMALVEEIINTSFENRDQPDDLAGSTLKKLIQESEKMDPQEQLEAQLRAENELRVSTTHECAYFQASEPTKCKHQIEGPRKTILQDICLVCEHGKEHADSLEHMAFMSPDSASRRAIRDFSEELKFGSPTQTPPQIVLTTQMSSHDSEAVRTKSPEPLDTALTIIEATDESSAEEDENDETVIQVDKFEDSFRIISRKSSSTSVSSSKSCASHSLSESTFIWSDSDDNNSDFIREKRRDHEKRNTLKRKCAFKDSSDEDQDAKKWIEFSKKTSRRVLRSRRRTSRNQTDDNWFVPLATTPLPSDLKEKKFHESGESIVQYYRDKDHKFKMKLNLRELKLNTSWTTTKDEAQVQVSRTPPERDELIWFTPAIPLPSIRRVDIKMKSNRKLEIEKQKRKLKKLEKLLSESDKASKVLEVEASEEIRSTSSSEPVSSFPSIEPTQTQTPVTSQSSSVSKINLNQATIIDESFEEPEDKNQEEADRTLTLEKEAEPVKPAAKSIGIVKSSLRKTPSAEASEKKPRRKSVRFNEMTFLINENDSEQTNKTRLDQEKGHFTVQDLMKEDLHQSVNYTLVPLKQNQSQKRLSTQNVRSSVNDSVLDTSARPSQIDPDYPSSVSSDSRSEDTVILDEAETTLPSTSKHSFYEYDSILFPKVSKYVEGASFIQDMSTLAEAGEDDIEAKDLNPTKVAKKEKKLLNKTSSISSVKQACGFLTLMSMELHVNTRGSMQPNPELDPIVFVCFTIYTQRPESSFFEERDFENHLIVYDQEKRSLATSRFLGIDSSARVMQKKFKTINYVYKEEEIFPLVLQAIRCFDPDILIGFEIQKLSWCYLICRANHLKVADFCVQISRLPKSKRESVMRIKAILLNKQTKLPDPKKPPTAASVTGSGSKLSGVIPVPFDLCVAGRVVLNLWRILRSEVSLNIYTFENCAYHILNERTPKFSFTTLSSWFMHKTDLFRWRVVEYYLYRTTTNLKLISRIDLIGKTSEFARVYGIEFYHVLSRGSQYRVESMMLRIARKLNYVALSASQKQKAHMRAPDCIPLTLEPESKFYTDPLAVLDFQSLYPSVIIAYNICFTTCLGRVESIGKEGSFKFGCASLFVPDSLIKKLDLEKDVFIAPSGIAFVKPHIRKSLLAIMLEDILRTRVMVKNSMKLYKDNENLQKIFDSRQLSLKLIANVTYGYTAANFSGRMPCVEVGDTIVRVGRQTLENSIKYIQLNTKRFGARVVYGDTDSLFVIFKNTSKDDAFQVSYKMVDEITNMNPKPLKLKFEKIYYPSVLLAKKRYVGAMYETPEQSEPDMDAKGIEVVRRDGCQIASKTLEKCLKILFEFKEISKVRSFLVRQCVKITNGKVNLKDFVIAKEYRGRDGYNNMNAIAACQVANKALANDPLAEPLTGERVPYVIIYGMPGVPLYDLVRSPNDLLDNHDLKLNYEYYVMKQILPPLDRIISLMDENVFDWVKSLSFKPKIFQYSADIDQPLHNAVVSKKNVFSNYFYSKDCVLCGKKLDASTSTAASKKKQSKSQSLCDKCSCLDQSTFANLFLRFNKSEMRLYELIRICQVCTSNSKLNVNAKNECCSLDCPVLFTSLNVKQDFNKTQYLRRVIDEFF